MAELAYALDSGSSEGFLVGVQVPSTALKKEVTSDNKSVVTSFFSKSGELKRFLHYKR